MLKNSKLDVMSKVYEVEVLKTLPTRLYIEASSVEEAEATATLIGEEIDDERFPYCEGQVSIEAQCIAEVDYTLEDDDICALKKNISIKDINSCGHLYKEEATLLKEIYKEN